MQPAMIAVFIQSPRFGAMVVLSPYLALQSGIGFGYPVNTGNNNSNSRSIIIIFVWADIYTNLADSAVSSYLGLRLE
jgi:hypothetical protein